MASVVTAQHFKTETLLGIDVDKTKLILSTSKTISSRKSVTKYVADRDLISKG